MSTLADSFAFKDQESVLPQHQAALTLLDTLLSSPAVEHLTWIDLACGRGQIISLFDERFSASARAKIDYWAYDSNQDYVMETKITAERLGFDSIMTIVGDLKDLNKKLTAGKLFDFITLTNTVHETDTNTLLNIIASCIQRLTDIGVLYIYDMEKTQQPELGALTWRRDDFRRIILCILNAFGATNYRPEVVLWNHKTCRGWSVRIEWQHLNISRTEAAARSNKAIQKTQAEILQMLKEKFEKCQNRLEEITRNGTNSADEKELLLHEHWALSRVLKQNH